MVGWHHRLNGHEFEQTPGDGEGQGSLECCSPWGHKEWDGTELLNNKYVSVNPKLLIYSSPFSPSVTLSLFSMFVGLFLFCI